MLSKPLMRDIDVLPAKYINSSKYMYCCGTMGKGIFNPPAPYLSKNQNCLGRNPLSLVSGEIANQLINPRTPSSTSSWRVTLRGFTISNISTLPIYRVLFALWALWHINR
eukprot:IDg21878t1